MAHRPCSGTAARTGGCACRPTSRASGRTPSAPTTPASTGSTGRSAVSAPACGAASGPWKGTRCTSRTRTARPAGSSARRPGESSRPTPRRSSTGPAPCTTWTCARPRGSPTCTPSSPAPAGSPRAATRAARCSPMRGREVINPGFFREVDDRLRHINGKGMVVGLVLLYAIGDPSWRSLPSLEARLRFARYVVARYAAFHVVFIVTGEWQYMVNDGDLFRASRQGDPGHRPARADGRHPRGSGPVLFLAGFRGRRLDGFRRLRAGLLRPRAGGGDRRSPPRPAGVHPGGAPARQARRGLRVRRTTCATRTSTASWTSRTPTPGTRSAGPPG